MPMVRYDLDHLPEVPAEERKRVAAMSDEEIDYSDIPEVRDFSGFVRAGGRDAAERWSRVEIDLDSDVIAWIGEGYQSRINAILREVMRLTMLSTGEKS
ncbi:MAG: BrnA antitoxin family protein [Spirochaetaceae bacterium]|jgi:uncharacterized protein (DUF4415 family)|nr:BrnA antitoxin family protein [Spirochaetaceae bacterium]